MPAPEKSGGAFMAASRVQQVARELCIATRQSELSTLTKIGCLPSRRPRAIQIRAFVSAGADVSAHTERLALLRHCARNRGLDTRVCARFIARRFGSGATIAVLLRDV